MRKIPLMLAALLLCAGAHAEVTSRIRSAGLFLKGFSARRVAIEGAERMACGLPAGPSN